MSEFKDEIEINLNKQSKINSLLWSSREKGFFFRFLFAYFVVDVG